MSEELKAWEFTSGPNLGERIVATEAYMLATFDPATYVEYTYPVVGVQFRTLLTVAEWVDSWTAQEWRDLRDLSEQNTNPGRQLLQLYDEIRLSGTFDVVGDKGQLLYGFLESQGFITAQRRAELQQGVPM